MAASHDITTFGASILPTTSNTNDELTRPVPTLDSPALTPATSHQSLRLEHSDRPIPPHSPFYQHASDSFDRTHSRNTSRTHVIIPNEKDLEVGVSTPLSTDNENNPFRSKVSVDCTQECKMWPSKQTLMQSKMAEKEKVRKRDHKYCACGSVRNFWARMSKKQKLLIKIAIAVFLVGIAVTIGVCISIAVNGTVYSGNGQTSQVGQGT